MNKSIYKLSTKDQIDWLARFVIVHSIIYYEWDYNVVSDKKYDEYARYLAALVKENPEEVKSCYYYYVIYDFDGSTGFDLRGRLTEPDNDYVSLLALHVMQDNKKSKK